MSSASARDRDPAGPLDSLRRWFSATWEGVVIAVAVIMDNKVRSVLTILGWASA